MIFFTKKSLYLLPPKLTLYLQFSSPIFLQGAFITLPEDYQIVLILRSAIWEMIVLGKTTRERKYMAFINPWMQSFSLTREHQIIPDSFESMNFPTLAEFYWYFQLTYKSQAACCVVNK